MLQNFWCFYNYFLYILENYQQCNINNSNILDVTLSPLQHPEDEIRKLLDDEEAEIAVRKEIITEIKNYIPFQHTSIHHQDSIYPDITSETNDRRSKSQTLSEESYREETTVRMSTQFLDSRHSENGLDQDKIYTTPETNKYLSEKGIKQLKNRNTSKQWKVMYIY